MGRHAVTAVPVVADRVRPPWCGTCDEATRLVELADGRAARCSRCHPLRGLPTEPRTAEEADMVNRRAWRAAYGSLPPQTPITEEEP